MVREGDNALIVAVTDDSDTGDQAYGKQKLERGGIWYTGQSGIWQTVWAESVPREYIRGVRITPRPQDAAADFEIDWAGEAPPESRIRIFEEGKLAAEAHFSGAKVKISLPGFRSWSPDDPFLYTVSIEAGEDAVESYFGMREFSTVRDAQGCLRLALNGKPIFQTGLLDQGYWSDGLYTAPSDEAIVWELTEIKRMGYNMLRKHIKIEPLRWYYHCDRLGILVWQDFVSGGGPYSPMVTQLLPYVNVRLSDNHYRRFGARKRGGPCGVRGRYGANGFVALQRSVHRGLGAVQRGLGPVRRLPYHGEAARAGRYAAHRRHKRLARSTMRRFLQPAHIL